MPGELTPSEYRERVRSSQRRVEQWIRETSRHMPFAVYDPPEGPTQQDTLEAGPPENAQRAGSSTQGGSSSKEVSHSLRKGAIVGRTHEDEDARRGLDQRSSSPHRRSTRDVDQDPSAHSRSRTRRASSTKKSSSRHDHTSRGAPTATTGKPSIGSSSKDKDRHRSSRHSHSTSHRTRARDKYDRANPRSKSTAIDIISLLPYGILPLLFAMTGGSSVISFAAAGLMLVGYFAIDYTTLRPSSSKSRRS